MRLTVLKKILSVTIILSVLLSCINVNTFAASESKNQINIYVSVDGNDNASGTKDSPFATIAKAQKYVRKINKNMNSDIVVNIMGGVYYQNETLAFTEEDSSTNGFSTTYKAYNDEEVIVSGGIELTGWKQSEEYENLWEIKVPDSFPKEQYISHLYLGDKVATMPREYIKAKSVKTGAREVVFAADSGFVDNVGQSDIVMRHQHLWMDGQYPVEKISINEDGDYVLTMSNNDGSWDSGLRDGHGNPDIWEFEVINSFGLLTEPGEFYYNRAEKTIYYYKDENEELDKIRTVIPNLETVLSVAGKNSHHKIENLGFEGLTFSHTMSQYTYEYGSATCQAWQDLSGVMDERYRYPLMNCGSSIRVSHTENFRFVNNDVCQSNSFGMLVFDGTYNADIEGNNFYDLGSSGMVVGSSGSAARDFEADFGLTNISLGKKVTSGNMVYHARNTPQAIFEPSYNVGGYIEAGSWLQVDFGEPYSIDGIYIDSGDLPNFKYRIIASNDESFSEYELITTHKKNGYDVADFTSPHSSTKYQTLIKVGDPTKYRYVRVINEATERYSLGNIAFFTDDLGGAKNWDLVYNCDVSNNYFTRCCTEQWHQCVATIIMTDTLNFTHNEIAEAPYTGINLGTNHSLISYSVAKDNIIGYNKVENASQRTQDGGPLYTSGPQKGTKIIGNYFTGQDHGMALLYPDQGSSYYEITQNVLEDGAFGLYPWATDSTDLYLHDNYASTPNYRKGAANSKMVNTELFVRHRMPEHIQKIADFAGLTDEWKHIKDRVPEGNSPNYRHDNEVYTHEDYRVLYNEGSGWNFLSSYVKEADMILKIVNTSSILTPEYEDEYAAFRKLTGECKSFLGSVGDTELEKYYEYVGILDAAIDEFATCGLFDNLDYKTIMDHKEGATENETVGNQILISNDATVEIADLFIDDFSDGVYILPGSTVYAEDDKSQMAIMRGGTSGAFYKRALFGDVTYDFTMNFQSHVGGDCPGIMFRTQQYSYIPTGYIIDFVGSSIEIQRFNDNVRTVFYGNIAGCEPKIAASLPYTIALDKDINVKVTVKDEAEGVRIILNVDGVELCNFVDKYEDGAIAGKGFTGFMSPSSNMRLKRTTPVAAEFVDLVEYDWAAAYIYTLMHNDVVNGDGSLFFRPENDVTRAEYCKMLAQTLGVSGGKNTFSDVKASDWYNSYVAALCGVKAFDGVFGSSFNGDAPITRQEAAAITYNALKAKGVKGTETEFQAFADESLISAGLKDKVNGLAKMGFVTGNQNNRFEPANHISRAEASVLIYRVFSKK